MNVTPAPQPPGAGTGARQATAREFLAVVFRRKGLILGLFVVTTATMLAIAFTTPVNYISSGRLLLRRGERESALGPNRELYSQWEEDLGTEVEVVKSWDVLQLAQKIVSARPGPAPKLTAGQVDAEVMGKSNVIAIAYEDRDPEAARRAAAALMDAYIEFKQNRLTLSYPRRFFDDQIAAARVELQRIDGERKEFTKRHDVVQIQEQQRSQLGLQGVLLQRQSEAAAELSSARAEQRAMRELQAHPEVDLPTLGASGTHESALTEIKRRMVQQEAHIAELRERYRDDALEVVAAHATLDTLRSMLRREVDARLTVSGSHAQALEAGLASINRDLAGVGAELAGMPEKESRMAQLDRDLGIAKTRYEDLLRKARDAEINEFVSSPLNVIVLSPAGPAVPRNTRDYVRLALAPAFSLLVGVGLAFFIDGLDLTVRTTGHAEEAVDLPVLAAITERRRRSGWARATNRETR